MTSETTPQDEAKLRELAEKAPVGPWFSAETKSYYAVRNSHYQLVRTTVARGSLLTEEGRRLVAFIAAANPAAIIHHLDTLASERAARERAEAALKAMTEALEPFAAVSRKAKGADDACWCGQDGAVIRYRDLRRAEALAASQPAPVAKEDE